MLFYQKIAQLVVRVAPFELGLRTPYQPTPLSYIPWPRPREENGSVFANSSAAAPLKKHFGHYHMMAAGLGFEPR
jgi:hypothetical protein